MLGLKKWMSLALVAAALLAHSPAAYSCTTFVLRGPNVLVFGRNLDWVSGTGLLIVNPRNLQKFALSTPPDRPAQWISKYGSVTFNQVGRDLPYGGINEAGLVVEHMTLDKAKYPAADDREALQACQWIQYQLDTCSTVEEVIKSDAALRISDVQSKFHFLVCDKSGRAAVIEFLDGKMVSYLDKKMPIPVLANSTYAESLARYGRAADVAADRSIYNFATAAAMVKENKADTSDSAVASAFSVLAAVSQGVNTKWSIVYDLHCMDIHFKVFETPHIDGPRKIFLKPVGAADIRSINLKELDFDCRKTPKVIDLDSKQTGGLNPFLVDYTSEINLASIAKAFDFFKKWGLPIQISREDMVALSEYPNSFKCLEIK
jgi:choloylglycine hydrolase